jgi:hypothetical protein
MTMLITTRMAMLMVLVLEPTMIMTSLISNRKKSKKAAQQNPSEVPVTPKFLFYPSWKKSCDILHLYDVV